MKPRNVAGKLLDALGDTPVVLIQGARQTGKTTLAQSLTQREAVPRGYLTLDDAAVLAATKQDPAGFVAGLRGPVVIDEVQHAPELFPAIKRAVDADRTPGRFLLTGSANVLALPKLSESLAGRMELLTLWPFSQGELEGRVDTFIDQLFSSDEPVWLSSTVFPSTDDIWQRVILGGFPEAQVRRDAQRRRAWFGSYVTTILQRDVRELAQIEGLKALPRILELLASRTGSLLNHSELSRVLGIPATSLKRYFALLEATFFVRTLAPWASNRGKRLVKSPKVFLADTGMVCSLIGVEGEALLREPRISGGLLENFVTMELTKQASWSRTAPKLFHYRTQAGQEVDLVLEDAAGKVVGVEVKSASSIGTADLRGLRHLAEAVGDRFLRGVVLYTGASVVPFAKELHALPLSALWSGGTLALTS